jgi:hypothetical protein
MGPIINLKSDSFTIKDLGNEVKYQSEGLAWRRGRGNISLTTLR